MTKSSGRGDELWVKVVGMLQQNWASIEPTVEGVCILFVSDTGGIFDRMPSATAETAEAALARNGFRQFSKATDLQGFLHAPARPFHEVVHPKGFVAKIP